ncbi:MAG: YdbH domain-containing protein, partial [Lentisphaeria bacterium]|nr:YdbH domain-containing protein [Lentisphaeria bacterium]
AVIRSAPGQTLTFQSVKYDKIETGAGKFAFRMEAPDTWQIENALLDWCGGHIRLGGVTYRPGQTTTEAVLYCDRLNLPVFLTQIGLGQISGSGAINGTIPIVVTQKEGQVLPDNLYFEDAFLFSTPGEDGVIQGDIDEAILSSEGGVEMELAKDALKDFSYSWVRVNMLSTGENKEDMKLSLQLDGRPNRALYYAFDEKTASFMKTNTPCIFQGIRLDTNVNVESGKALELVDYVKQIFSRGD